MAQQSHVPKFGNWEGENVPYTAFFENARKDKIGGFRINPNDPEQNPEAFNIGGGSSHQHKTDRDDSRKIMPPGWDPNTHASVPPSPGPYSMNHADYSYCRSTASVPKFGQWDEHDPSSTDGFTVIFNKVKEEKQIAAAKFPSLPLNNNPQCTTQQNKTKKRCCCLF